jgi:hypothetical protein
MRPFTTIAAILTAALTLCPAAKGDSTAPGGISFFRADVTVREDSTLDVREEITVNDAAAYYKRGFRRVLPISVNDLWDPRYVPLYQHDNGIRVEILEVTEDGHPVDYKQGSGYVYPQLSIGPQNVPLDRDEHHFTLHYIVDSALTASAERDLLYWNAIGVNGGVPVAEAFLAIHLPSTISEGNIEVEPRVASQGGRSKLLPSATLERVDDPSGAIVYRATNVGPRQSLSLAVTWPVGFVKVTKYSQYRRDAWLFAAPGIVFLYYLIASFRIGPDRKPGAVQARYEPPDGLSPAAIRYIASGTTDGRTFAAVIAQLATRGCLRVESVNGKIKLSNLMSDRATQSALAPEEAGCLSLLFEDGPTIELSPAMDERNTAQNGLYVQHIHDVLSRQLSGKYFSRHSGTIALGVLMTLFFAAILAATAKGRDTTGAFMFTFWILFVGLMIGMMIEMSFLSAWQTVIRAGRGWAKMLPGTLAVTVFLWVIGFMLKKLSEGVSLSYAVMLVAFLLINLGWAPLLKRKTQLGRRVTDEIAGFSQFLQKVEQDQLNRLGGIFAGTSDESRKLDALLPYAIALEVKEAWGDQLAQAFLATTVFTEQ